MRILYASGGIYDIMYINKITYVKRQVLVWRKQEKKECL